MVLAIIIFVLFHTCTAELAEILTLQKDRCVVTLFNVNIGSAVGSFFSHFVEEFSNNFTESYISFRELKAPFLWDDGSYLDMGCRDECSTKIGIFKKNPADLKCLFPVPPAKHTRVDVLYENILNVDIFAEFINEYCQTFFSASGLPLKEDIFKHWLEENVRHSQDLPTLEEVIHQQVSFNPMCFPYCIISMLPCIHVRI